MTGFTAPIGHVELLQARRDAALAKASPAVQRAIQGTRAQWLAAAYLAIPRQAPAEPATPPLPEGPPIPQPTNPFNPAPPKPPKERLPIRRGYHAELVERRNIIARRSKALIAAVSASSGISVYALEDGTKHRRGLLSPARAMFFVMVRMEFPDISWKETARPLRFDHSSAMAALVRWPQYASLPAVQSWLLHRAMEPWAARLWQMRLPETPAPSPNLRRGTGAVPTTSPSEPRRL